MRAQHAYLEVSLFLAFAGHAEGQSYGVPLPDRSESLKVKEVSCTATSAKYILLERTP